MTSVIIVDDHELVRAGIKQILANAKGINVIAEANNGSDAIQLIRQHNPDIVLLDLKLPDLSGLEVTEKLMRTNPDLKIIVVTSVTNDLFPFRLLQAGASGYMTKNSTQDEIINAIQSVKSGKRYISPQIANQLVLSKMAGKRKESPFDTLSNKEMEVMLMVCRGLSVKVIAEKLHLSPKTINSYRYRIFEKLDVNNDIEMMLQAIRYGVVDIDKA